VERLGLEKASRSTAAKTQKYYVSFGIINFGINLNACASRMAKLCIEVRNVYVR